jgi:polyisoprenyl-phosphate glycosyltransferase
MPTVDLVIPVYNEQDALPAFHGKLRQSIDSISFDFTIYYVDDGSTDTTCDCLH